MCGIAGYIGKNEAAPVLLESLKRLEYRGYDSAGLAVIDKNNKINSIKVNGRINILEKELRKNDPLEGSIGISHTRWATHGEPSKKNAHPHSDCEENIWVAHNGIIENYKILKEQLEKEGHQFKSDTDTEVISHLIEKYFKKNGQNLEEAVRQALEKIEGAYGLAIIARDEPDKIIAVRKGSPLVIGLGQNEYFISSDPSAIIGYTKQVIYLDDEEMAIIKKDGFKVVGFDNIEKEKIPQETEWDVKQIQKSGFSHFMLKEIFEEPEAIRNSIRGRLILEEGLAKLGGLESVAEKLKEINRLIIVACGTARYAGLVGEYMIEEYAGIPVEVDMGSEFRYRKPIIDKKTAVLAISQSGETADTLAALREAKRKGALTLGITNVVGSTQARETEAGVYNHVGPELTVLALLAIYLGRQREMSLITGRRIGQELQKLPDLAEKILKQDQRIKNLAKKYSKFKNFFFLGRKYNLGIAEEGAIKLKEIAYYVHAESYPGGEMKHGPIALIDENLPSVFIVPSDSVYEKMINAIEETKARRGKIIAIATEGNEEIKKIADEVIYIPKTLEMLTPILSVIPLHLFSAYMGLELGCDIDKPRNLAKSVTVE
jgi:glucosamine--fructose-6-phosphate aminotransferase (isomerizing)